MDTNIKQDRLKKLKGKEKRFEESYSKFQKYEKLKESKYKINKMIKGQVNQDYKPKLGEFYIKKFENDNALSMAEKIGIKDLLDDTKTYKELEEKYQDKKSNKNVGKIFKPWLTKDLKKIMDKQNCEELSTSNQIYDQIINNCEINEYKSNKDKSINISKLVTKNKIKIVKNQERLTKNNLKNNVFNDLYDNINYNKKKNYYKIKSKNNIRINGYNQITEKMMAEYKNIEINNFKKPLKLNPENFSKNNHIEKYSIEKNEVEDKKEYKEFKIISIENFIFESNYNKLIGIIIKDINNKIPVYGFSKYYNENQDYEWKKCIVWDYNFNEEMFTIQFDGKTFKKRVNRSNLFFEKEDKDLFFKKIKIAKYWQEICSKYLLYKNIIIYKNNLKLNIDDKKKDKLVKLILGGKYNVNQTRNPLEYELIELKEKYNQKNHFDNKILILKPNFNVIEEFKNRNYDIKVINSLFEEIKYDYNFVNFRLDFDPTLIYNYELKKMLGLDFIQNIVKEDNKKIDNRILNNTINKKEFLKVYKLNCKNSNVSNKEKLINIQYLNKFIHQNYSQKIIETNYFHPINLERFWENNSFILENFIKMICDIFMDIFFKLNKMVEKEEILMEKRNEIKMRRIIMEADRIAAKEKEIPKAIVNNLKRFQYLMNFKLEVYINKIFENSIQYFLGIFKDIKNYYLEYLKNSLETLGIDDIIDFQKYLRIKDNKINFFIINVNLVNKNNCLDLDINLQKFKNDLINIFDSYSVMLIDKINMQDIKILGCARKDGKLKLNTTKILSKYKEKLETEINWVFSLIEKWLDYLKMYKFSLKINIDGLKTKYKKLTFNELKKDLLKLNFLKTNLDKLFFEEIISFAFIKVNTEKIKKYLVINLEDIIKSIIKILIYKISKENEKLVNETQVIKNKLKKIPKNLDELEEIRQYGINIKEVLVPIKDKINSIKNKIDLLEKINYKISYEQFEQCWSSVGLPLKINKRVKKTLQFLEREEKKMEKDLIIQTNDLDSKISEITFEFEYLISIDNLNDIENISLRFVNLEDNINNIISESDVITRREKILKKISLTDYSPLQKLKNNFLPFLNFWKNAYNLKFKYPEILKGPLINIDKDQFTEDINNIWNELVKMEKNEFKIYSHMIVLSKSMRKEIESFRPKLPIINDLRNPGLKKRHWNKIIEIMDMETDINSFLQNSLYILETKYDLDKYIDEIRDISEIASRELGFEKIINLIKNDWKNIILNFDVYQDQNILKNNDFIFDKLDEDIGRLSGISTSPFIKFIENDLNSLKLSLQKTQELLELWLFVQKLWQYLFPIFTTGDIMKQLPQEQGKFEGVNKLYEGIMKNTYKNNTVIELVNQQRIVENLNYSKDVLESIIKNLNGYLNTKREIFSRFYFLPNEELLIILSKAKNVRNIQPFLNKCFEGINELQFEENLDITYIISYFNEKIKLKNIITPYDDIMDDYEEEYLIKGVEYWLKDVEVEMVNSLSLIFNECIKVANFENLEWIFDFPSQISCLAIQVLWTFLITDIFKKDDLDQFNLFYQQQKDFLNNIVNLIKSKENYIDILTLEILIVLQVHSNDIIEKFLNIKNLDASNFEWVSQLRYYNERKKINIKMLNSSREYGFEYLGNQSRLVITPLTDRCYRTLMSAMEVCLGGAPEGPAGTGKTETVKDLAKSLARHCIVFNCSEELDITQMNKFFKGLAACGSWACFDEFNRIEQEVLSVLAQQILTIQTNLLETDKKYFNGYFEFEGITCPLNKNCAIFITMNPGYAGRSELPDNLKILFRPIAMMVPNYALIAEISLYSYGFINARELANKLIKCFSLCSEQLSSQSHYDFGMRSVKSVLSAAGEIKKKNKSDNSFEIEIKCLLAALINCTEPKFIPEDKILFNDLIKDLFNEIKPINDKSTYWNIGLLISAIYLNLKLNMEIIHKINLFYETLKIRHGTMIIGEPSVGKTSILNICKLNISIVNYLENNYIELKEEFISKSFIKKRSTLNKNREDTQPDNNITFNNIFKLNNDEKIFLEFLKNKFLNNNLKENTINTFVLNPKSISIQLLYGEVDELSGDWKEGIASKYFKISCEENKDYWIIFDGPIDALWIENMNTVLDDNKKLCLANSEIIKLQPKTRVIFEAQNLAEASLATVSRCGMVFIENNLIINELKLKSWLKMLPYKWNNKQLKSYIKLLFNYFYPKAFEIFINHHIFKYKNSEKDDLNKYIYKNIILIFQSVIFNKKTGTEINQDFELGKEKIINKIKADKLAGKEENEKLLSKYMEIKFTNKDKFFFTISFFYSLFWSFGSLTDNQGKKFFQSIFNPYIQEFIGNELKEFNADLILPSDNIYDYYIDFNTNTWEQHLKNLLKFKIENLKDSLKFIPTLETHQTLYLSTLLVYQKLPILFCGTTGTGKTLLLKKLIYDELDKNKLINVEIVLTSNTKVDSLYNTFELKIEKQKRNKGIFGPLIGKKLFILIDDLNMPKKEKYGAQPVLELLRQFLSNEGYFDKKSLKFKKIEDMQIVSCLTTQRNALSDRLYFNYLNLYLSEYSKENTFSIFSKIFDLEVNDILKPFSTIYVRASIDLYNSIKSKFLPLPSKSHYIFNLRDIEKSLKGATFINDKDLKILKNENNLLLMITKLFYFENKCIFSDRFIDANEVEDFNKIAIEKINKYFIQDFKSKEKSKLSEYWENLEINNNQILFSNFIDENLSYNEVLSMTILKNKVEEIIVDYNSVNKNKINIWLFDEILINICKISRVLSRENGHLVLIGLGSEGKSTLSKISSFIWNYKFEIQGPIWIEYLQEIIKESGLKNKKFSLLLKDENLTENKLEDLNTFMNIGEVPNLFNTEDKDYIINEMKNINKIKSTENINYWSNFVNTCKINMHWILCLTPIGKNLRENFKNFPSLVNCSNIIWLNGWSLDSLKIYSGNYLENIEINNFIKEEEKILKLPEIFSLIYKKSIEVWERYKKNSKKCFYITPLVFKEFLEIYSGLIKTKQKSFQDKKYNYENGLLKLKECEEYIEVAKKEINLKQPILKEKSQIVEEIVKQVEKDSIETQKIKEEVKVEEEKATEKNKISKEIENQCNYRLSEAEPGLIEAEKALNLLKTSDFVEIKQYKKPKPALLWTFEAVLRLLGISFKKSYTLSDIWTKTVKELKKPDKFKGRLLHLDRNNITDKTITAIENIFEKNPSFKEKKTISDLTKALIYLYDWVIAMMKYDKTYKSILPLRKDLEIAKKNSQEAEAILNKKQNELSELIKKENLLKKKLEEKNEEKVNLEDEIKNCLVKLDRSEKLNKGLESEKIRWNENIINLDKLIESCFGDIIISTSCLTYFGPFDSNYRNKLLKKWIKICNSKEISINENYELTEFVSNKLQNQHFISLGLPSDLISIQNSIIMQKSSKYSLNIDPQKQFSKFILNYQKTIYKEKIIIQKIDKKLVRNLEFCLRDGYCIIIEDINENIPEYIHDILNKDIFYSGGNKLLNFNNDVVNYDNNFNMFLITNLPNPQYKPYFLSKIKLIDYTITKNGLKEQLLSVIYRIEEPNDEDEMIKLISENAQNNIKQKEIEDKILFLLNSSQGSILENVILIDSLTESKKNSEEIKMRMNQTVFTQEKILKNRKNYENLSDLVGVIFLWIKDLNLLNPMYQFSLKWYEINFKKSIEKAEKYKTKNVNKRIEILTNSFIVHIYKEICKCIFVKHKKSFALSLGLTIALFKNQINYDEIELLLYGKSKIDKIQNEKNSEIFNKLMKNEENEIKKNKLFEIFKLEKFENLLLILKKDYSKFNLIIETLGSEEDDFLSDNNLDYIQKLILTKNFKTSQFNFYINKFLENYINKEITQYYFYSLTDYYNESSNIKPLIFIENVGEDSTEDLKKMAYEKGLNIKFISLGKGQGEYAKKTIIESSKTGTWVVLQNCHLSGIWLYELVEILEDLKKNTKKVHYEYRTILTSLSCDLFPLSLIQNSIKITRDPPIGVKNNIVGIFKNLMSSKRESYEYENIKESKSHYWQTLFFSLTFFHSIIRERKRFGPVGWNNSYEFNNSDLNISLKQIKKLIIETSNTPIKTIKYLVAECFYGGRVTDEWDRRLLNVMVDDFINEDLFLRENKFTELEEYYIPKEELNLNNIWEYINNLPNIENSKLLCLNENSSLSSMEIISKNIIDDLNKIISIEKKESKYDTNENDIYLIKSLIDKVPKLFNTDLVKKKYPINYYESMNTFLIQEIRRYNNLFSIISNSLDIILKFLKGLAVLDTYQEESMIQIFQNKVPNVWLRNSFNTIKSWSNYMFDLTDRYKFYNNWIQNGKPEVFYISKLFFSQSFFTAILQNYARNHNISIDKLEFNHSIETKINKEELKDNYYISGLYLEGASYSIKNNCLEESLQNQIYYNIPYILFSPSKKDKLVEIEKYVCPLYTTTERRGSLTTTGHSSNFIISVNLNCINNTSNLWVKRGVALLSQIFE